MAHPRFLTQPTGQSGGTVAQSSRPLRFGGRYAATRQPWLGFLAFAAMGLTSAIAQVPDVFLLVKLATYQQTDATTLQPTGAQLGVQIGFSNSPASTTTVQLRAPNGSTVALVRQPNGSYLLERTFDSTAALDAAFPDGNYSAIVGGPTPSTTAVFVTTGAAISPVPITNFDTLQASPGPSATVRWQPVPGVNLKDFLYFSVYQNDGKELYTSPDNFSAFSTEIVTPSLPLFTPLTGELGYARVNVSVAANGGTGVATGRGFDVQFPMRCITVPPTISTQPQSILSGPGGGPFELWAFATGQGPLTYQWKKNGVLVPGGSGTNPSTDPNAQLRASLKIGTVQATDAGNYAVDVMNSAGTTTSTTAVFSLRPSYAGSIYAGTFGATTPEPTDGPRTSAVLRGPGALAVDRNGTLYFVDGSAIRKISADGLIRTVAGVANESGYADGTGAAARFTFFGSGGLAVDAVGNCYVADSGNQVIRKITPGGVVTTLAGSPGLRGFVDAAGSAARFNGPTRLALDSAANLYVCDLLNNAIRQVTPAGIVTTFAGLGATGLVDGVGRNARFFYPAEITCDGTGNLYVVDSGSNSAIRKITPAGVVTTISASAFGGSPIQGIATDSAGYIYVTVGAGVARLTPDAAVVGSGSLYYGITGVSTYFPSFNAVAVDANGNVYGADTINRVILKGVPVPGSADPGIGLVGQPQSHTLPAGGSVMLTATATGPALTYQWWKNGSVIADATSSQLYLATTSTSSADNYSVVIGNGISATRSSVATVSPSTTEDVGHMTNLAIRSTAGTDAQTLIVGFVVGGTGATGGKSVLLRGVGPALATFGVAGTLADPTITLVNGSQTIAANDNWDGSAALSGAFASVGAFALPGGSRDAAMTMSLSPGSYTLKLAGNGGATGIGLAEIYDLSGPATRTSTRLVNISTRTQVGTGSGVLIAGFAIGGQTSRTLLIRGVGPSLVSFGVANPLADPQLKLFSGQALIASNDDWNNDFTLGNVFRTVGAFDLSWARESALLITLPPGLYTAQVSDKAERTGVALVEIYELP